MKKDDLISRAATLERMKSMAGCATCDNYNYVRCRACSWNDAMNIVEEMSGVKAAQVVYCGECKYMMPDGRCYEFADDCIRPSASDYCSRGERRDSE